MRRSGNLLKLNKRAINRLRVKYKGSGKVVQHYVSVNNNAKTNQIFC